MIASLDFAFPPIENVLSLTPLRFTAPVIAPAVEQVTQVDDNEVNNYLIIGEPAVLRSLMTQVADWWVPPW